MREFDLIAVLDGTNHDAPVAGVQMVPAGGLTAVLSTVPRPLMRLPQSRANQLLATATLLALQEACMTHATLLPARQNRGMTRAGASAFLLANQPFLKDLMTRFRGLAQVQVTVSWNAPSVLQRFSHEVELAAIFARGHVTPADLAAAIPRLAARLGGIIAGILADACVDMAPLPVAQDVLWNGALLVPTAALLALDQAVEAVDAIWPEGLRIRQIGPAPVASFALLEVEPVSPAQIAAALGQLGLHSLPDLRELAAARRQHLMAAPTGAQDRDAIRAAARIVEAAGRLPEPHMPLTLCRIWAEGRATSAPLAREVA